MSRIIRGSREAAELALALLKVTAHRKRIPSGGTKARSVGAAMAHYIEAAVRIPRTDAENDHHVRVRSFESGADLIPEIGRRTTSWCSVAVSSLLGKTTQDANRSSKDSRGSKSFEFWSLWMGALAIFDTRHRRLTRTMGESGCVNLPDAHGFPNMCAAVHA